MRCTVTPGPHVLSAGTRLPAISIGGHPVPAPGARWTLLVFGDDAERVIAWHAHRLAAEAVSPIPVHDAAVAAAAVLVDSQGVVQHVGGGVGESLDVVRDLRLGDRLPVAAAPQHASPCEDVGRRRRGVLRAPRAAH